MTSVTVVMFIFRSSAGHDRSARCRGGKFDARPGRAIEVGYAPAGHDGHFVDAAVERPPARGEFRNHSGMGFARGGHAIDFFGREVRDRLSRRARAHLCRARDDQSWAPSAPPGARPAYRH